MAFRGRMQRIRILVLCTGNSCRSQIAEAVLRSLDSDLAVYSAGTEPERRVHPLAIQVLREAGLSVRDLKPKHVEPFLQTEFDFVITVCDRAREICPAFAGKTKHLLHLPFEDPAAAEGSETEKLQVFRRIRDEILATFRRFYQTHILPYKNAPSRTAGGETTSVD